jgi:hypothetical protein
MPANPKSYGLSASGGVKYLFYRVEADQARLVTYSPFFFVEARIDFNDVRTGFRSTVSLSKALEIYSVNSDMLWSDDMIRDIDPEKTTSQLPDSGLYDSLPDFVNAGFMPQMETQFISYLLRSYKVKVYRNFALNIYSTSAESLSEFAARCRELVNETQRKELNTLGEVFNRKLEQVKQKYLMANASDSFELARTDSQNREVFLDYAEKIADLFLYSGAGARTENDFSRRSLCNQELVERLVSLESEARQANSRFRDSCDEKARSIDEYILHPTLKDVHLVRSCILWIPQKAV